MRETSEAANFWTQESKRLRLSAHENHKTAEALPDGGENPQS